MKYLLIIQARLNSLRFKNKIIKKIYKEELILHQIKRLRLSKKIDQIIVACTKNKNDDRLVKLLKKNKIKYFRGSEDNVLDRFYKCAKKFNPLNIIRVTSDCPLLDYRIIEKGILKFDGKNYDYLSNTLPPTFPDGMDFEILTYNCLKKIKKLAKTLYDKEHVTSFVRYQNNIKKFNLFNNTNLFNFARLTLDEKEDFKIISRIIKNFYPRHNYKLADIIKYLKENPNLINSNKIFMKKKISKKITDNLWKKSKKLIQGGNMLLSKNPDRILKNKWPSHFQKAKGCNVWDLDGNKYTDLFLMGVGTNTLGYSNINIDNFVKRKINQSNLSTLNCAEEVYLADKLLKLHKWSDKVRFTRSGGEANAVAIRIARSFTGNDKVAVCGYHGWHDWYLAANLSNISNLNNHIINNLEPNGVPKNLKNTIFSFKYNDIKSLKKIIKRHKISIIKMEVVRDELPQKNFLKEIRKLCNEKKIVLIFDECTTGFRENLGGIHKKFNVNPDIAIFGKTLGNGYAINAIIGKKKIMESANNSFISSTFWTERIGPAAGLATIKEMKRIKSWKIVLKQSNKIKNIWKKLSKKYNLKIKFFGIPSLIGFNFISSNNEFYKSFIKEQMLMYKFLASNRVYVSISHTDKILKKYEFYLNRVFKMINEFENGKKIIGN